MATTNSRPPKTTSDDIYAAVYSLLAAVDALEEWAVSHVDFEDLPLGEAPAASEPHIVLNR